ncbi:MAG: transcription termination/antitermination protein NusG [Coriobacteriia bacterium]|nr:transcription termination/antitermination protein NusG [Coriobacteriia bacterium]
MAKKWYVVHTYSGHENKVKTAILNRIESLGLADQIFDIQIPTETVVNKDDGRRQEKKIYPGYILVQMDMNDNSWYIVRNTPGVTGFIGSQNKPVALTRDEYNVMMRKSKSGEAPLAVTNFKIGQVVRIQDGAFTDFDATIVEINVDKGTLRCNVTLFGRETPVELEFSSVETIE